ncbi:MAG: ABC-F family ATP-binding cassette domain-containing protein [Clostridia bacterium]
MSILSVHGLKLSFITRLIMQDVSFDVNFKDKIGLVGVNGSGKTTLFHILEGSLVPDEGSVYRNRELKLGITEQNVSDIESSLYEYVLSVFSNLSDMQTELDLLNVELMSVNPERRDSLIKKQAALNEGFETLGGLTYKNRVRSTLFGLGFSDEEQRRPISTFSGGQKNKAQLARVLLSDANLLLLDEPTNHLDITSTEWLEDFLSSYRGAFIVISHDRYFLDRVTERTFELKNQHISVTEGNYSRHVELTGSEREIAIKHYQNTQKEIRRISAIVEQQRRFGRERNFITAASKLKQIERLKATLVEPEKELSSIHFTFKANDNSGNDVLVGNDLRKSFDGKSVFKNVDLLIKKGERVFLLGDNGCGKTTLLKIFARKLYPDMGSFYLGSNVKFGYYDQNVNNVNMNNTIINEVHDYYPMMNLGELRNALAAFLFRGDDVNKGISVTSGGERARIQLLKLMLSGANLLFLDEPTNHLDIASREALEGALIDYGGTMLIVTHDRYLVNRLADRVLFMTSDGLIEVIGGYDEFLSMKAENERALNLSNRMSEKPNAYKLQKDLTNAHNRVSGEIKRIEEKIDSEETALDAINRKLSEPSFDYKKTLELSEKASEKKAEIDALYDEWERINARLSDITNEMGDV